MVTDAVRLSATGPTSEAAEVGRRLAAELLDLVGLSEKADLKVHTLSRGQKQRLGFARALVQGPKVLLLDEPASGLDPRARIDLRDLVRRQAAEGACVVVADRNGDAAREVEQALGRAFGE